MQGHRRKATRLGVILSMALLVSIVGMPTGGAAGTFWDDDGNPHEADIEAIAAAGITQGCGPGQFCPTSPVTRAQMAEFLTRAFDLPAASGDRFTDIASSPHRAAINAIAAQGISNGCADGRFCPNALVTRAEMASFLVRAADLQVGASTSRFTDDNGSVHEPDIEALAVAGITRGCGGTLYCPFGAVARDQMASFLTRTLGLQPIPVPPPATGDGVRVGTGDDLTAMARNHPPGTVFLLDPGVHHLDRVYAKDGQVFRGQAGVIANGRNQSRAAFIGSGNGVVIERIVFENYVSEPTFGVIQPAESSRGWTIQDSEFRYNASVGLVFQSDFRVLRNNIHHNGQLGIKGYGDGTLVEGNTISHNNYEERFDFGWEAGGSKFIRTTNLTLRDNHVHDNRGPGLWSDGFNRHTLYEGNLVENNAGPGIFHEISYEAIIRNNVVRGNAHDFYSGGILIANSSGVEVYGNTVSGNDGGIFGLEDNRSSGGVPLIVVDLWVHDNDISFTRGSTGLWSNHGTGIYERNNRFDRNHYTVTSDRPFRWNNEFVNWAAWRAAGHDGSGTIR